MEQNKKKRRKKLNVQINQQSEEREVCVVMSTFTQETSLTKSHVILSGKTNKKHTCLTSGDADGRKEPLGSA